MALYNIIAVLITASAFFSFLNYRFLKLPTTIGLMCITFTFSLGLIVSRMLGVDIEQPVIYLLTHIDFSKTVLQGFLSFLLFAGALHVNLEDLLREKWVVGVLATMSVVLSTGMIGGVLYCVLPYLGFALPFAYCLLFGALISPTDPIAVLSMLKGTNTSSPLRLTIAGESLFNDGIGVVLFAVMLYVVNGSGTISVGKIGALFLTEAIGGIAFGFAIGFLTYALLKRVDNYQVEILLTLAAVVGGYALALFLHVSGPLAMVVVGLLVGNHGRRFAMSEKTRERLDSFWELVDELLNAVLFMLIGLEVLLLAREMPLMIAGISAIPIALLARYISVSIPMHVFAFAKKFPSHASILFTWSGLRGGISLAMALGIPASSERELIILMTYAVVAFSIIVQGITVKPLLDSSLKKDPRQLASA